MPALQAPLLEFAVSLSRQDACAPGRRCSSSLLVKQAGCLRSRAPLLNSDSLERRLPACLKALMFDSGSLLRLRIWTGCCGQILHHDRVLQHSSCSTTLAGLG
jgi:hypothetical protein